MYRLSYDTATSTGHAPRHLGVEPRDAVVVCVEVTANDDRDTGFHVRLRVGQHRLKLSDSRVAPCERIQVAAVAHHVAHGGVQLHAYRSSLFVPVGVIRRRKRNHVEVRDFTVRQHRDALNALPMSHRFGAQ